MDSTPSHRWGPRAHVQLMDNSKTQLSFALTKHSSLPLENVKTF